MHSFRRIVFGLFVSCALYAAAPRALEIREGDTICLVGNTLAERMQHVNYWETLLHQHYPKHRLVVRNLAWPADEVALRPRAEGFGEPEQHLAFSKADVSWRFSDSMNRLPDRQGCRSSRRT